MSWSSISELADAVEDRLDLVDVLVRGVLVMLVGVGRGVEAESGSAEGTAGLLIQTELVIKLSGLFDSGAAGCVHVSLGSEYRWRLV